MEGGGLAPHLGHQDDRHLVDPLPTGSLHFAPRCSSHRYGVLQAGGRQPTNWHGEKQGRGSKKDESSVRVEMEIDGCPAQNKPMQNVYFDQYDAPVFKMTLYPLQ